MLNRIAPCCGRAAADSLMLVFCGCQSWADLKARFSFARPQPAPAPAASEPTPPITKAQKADMQMAVARCFENEGKVDEAIEAYLEVYKADGKRVDACHRLAILHDMKGDSRKSREYYEEALKKEPKNVELLCDYGYSCYLQRDWADAETHLRRA